MPSLGSVLTLTPLVLVGSAWKVAMLPLQGKNNHMYNMIILIMYKGKNKKEGLRIVRRQGSVISDAAGARYIVSHLSRGTRRICSSIVVLHFFST